ncbi:MAG: hypothetical protein IJ991_12695, partial [Thermoguttaceae bacterium]|nr:hypothetical protein [Thermoguttaceae bacterium]
MLNLGEYLAPPFFDSISENYEDVMIKHANPFDSKLWIDTIIDNRKKQSFRFFAKELIPFRKNTISVHLLPLLPIINSIIREKGICSITDLGGVIGDNHTEIFNYYYKDMRNKIHYNIIETPNNCILGCQLDQTKKINFVSNDPDAQKGVEIDYILNELQSDIVIICSTLQYLHPYKELLYKFTQSKTKYIYITRT